MDKDKLYDALGELMYAVTKADGEVQASEVAKLKELLARHPWSAAIQWSFDYENSRHITLEEAYAKALQTCQEYGPSEEYVFLFEVLDAVAAASSGKDVNEMTVIERFKKELRAHFLEEDLSGLTEE
ncbi:MAG: hypothetical protein KIPDCIKN_01523 [Haliscomenobacter sp.]|jgi:hypothetical protein|nr:hypothetical protein [Haliscomenobacter sp.]